MSSIAVAAGDPPGSRDPVVAELIALEAERRNALVANDMGRFSALIAEDIVHVHSTGTVHGKAELLAHAGGLLQFLDIRRGPLRVRRLAPDVAVMTGSMTNIVRRRDHDERVEVRAFVTQLWVRRGDGWQITGFHAVRVPEEQDKPAGAATRAE